MTQQNFNRAMATAVDLVVAEVEEIVPGASLAEVRARTTAPFAEALA